MIELILAEVASAVAESVAAALRTLVVMTAANRRSWAILSPVAELGKAIEQASARLERIADGLLGATGPVGIGGGSSR